MTKTFSDNCDKILCSKQAASLFPDVQMQLKTFFFVPFVRPCMHYKYGGISESYACKDRVWPGPALADVGPNARPGRGAPLSSDFMTSSCSANRVTIVVERRYTVQN